MTKTLWCGEKETDSALEIPKYHKITATEIDYIEEGKRGWYEDEEGNRYIVSYNRFKNRQEFTRIH